MPSTIRLHRVLRAPPERVYRAFLDAGALAKWLPPHGYTAQIHQLDARVGGAYRMSFTSFADGQSQSFGGTFAELVPGERIVRRDAFDNPDLPGTLTVTVTLRAVFCGTEMDVVQDGIPDVIPPEACHLGWQQSLELLARLVEVETGTPA